MRSMHAFFLCHHGRFTSFSNAEEAAAEITDLYNLG